MLDSTPRMAISRGRPCERGPVWRELGRKVPRVDGALSTQPGAQAAPPVRNTSSSSMQSPPAKAEATSVISLLPELAQPGASPRSRCCWSSWGRLRCWANVAGRSSPALATRRWSSKTLRIRPGWLHGSILYPDFGPRQ